MTIFSVIQLYPIYTLTSKQSNKHILIVVKCLQLSTNIIGSATEIVCRRKEEYTQKDCGESSSYH